MAFPLFPRMSDVFSRAYVYTLLASPLNFNAPLAYGKIASHSLSFAFGTRSGRCHSLDPPLAGERVSFASREGGIIPACGIIALRRASISGAGETHALAALPEGASCVCDTIQWPKQKSQIHANAGSRQISSIQTRKREKQRAEGRGRETNAARDCRKEIYASPRRYERDLHGSIHRLPRLVERKTEKDKKRETEIVRLPAHNSRRAPPCLFRSRPSRCQRGRVI